MTGHFTIRTYYIQVTYVIFSDASCRVAKLSWKRFHNWSTLVESCAIECEKKCLLCLNLCEFKQNQRKADIW